MNDTPPIVIEEVARAAEERTRQLLAEFASSGRRPEMPPFLSAEKRVLAIKAQSNGLHLGMELAALCNELEVGEYVALHLFCELNEEAMGLLQKLTRTLEEKTGAEVIWICGLEGFGERRPESGIHLQLTARTFEPPEVGSAYLQRHLRAVAERELLLAAGLRLMRIDLGGSVVSSLERFELTVSQMKTRASADTSRALLSWLPWNMPPEIRV